MLVYVIGILCFKSFFEDRNVYLMRLDLNFLFCVGKK